MAFIPQVTEATRVQREAYQNETRVRMRVECRPLLQAICGALVPNGVHEIEVPASQVESVASLVEDRPEMIEAARSAFENELRDWLAEGKSEATFPGSLEASFFSIMRRGIRPLVSAEVVERDIAPPAAIDAAKAARTLALASQTVEGDAAAPKRGPGRPPKNS